MGSQIATAIPWIRRCSSKPMARVASRVTNEGAEQLQNCVN